ncbi:MAG: hypothetical protein VX438_00565 [Planctomycetota bacterium]|nr:hypothetical protein [Planctomycetota bacterium]
MRFSAIIAITLAAFYAGDAFAQRIRFPQTPPPSTGLQNPNFSPTQPGAALGNPNLAPAYNPYPVNPGLGPAVTQPYGQPGLGAPYTYNPGNVSYPPYPANPGGYPPSPGMPNQAQGIFGNRAFGYPYATGNQDWLNRFEKGRYLRVVQEVHFRHTWLEGSNANEVNVHDAELGLTLNWPNFLGSGEPLQISPTFIFHFWDGPQTPSTRFLPSRAYSTFLAGAWSTPTNRNFGGEIVTSLGVYTDFNTFNNRSLRVKGTGLGWIRLTPTMTFKFGVSYLNRLDIKLLPVGGLAWKPSENMELELYFPNPKIKYSLPQIGNTELSAYLTANYGGDSWTIGRLSGFSDQVDMIDLRVLGGIEFVGFRGFRGFLEAGYAFNREIIYRVDPTENLNLSDSAIVRAGFLF